MRSIIVVAAALAGCMTIDSKPIEMPMPTPAERVWQDNAFPMLVQQCAECHRYNQVGFLDGNNLWEVRETLVTSTVVDLQEPTKSRLLVMGVHSGPALTAEQTSTLLEWLTAERAER
ncbi:MAG TPA: hypothetical protein VMZ53_32220 [Kofleriaceae bacterium]|nr:hypothetical protein [Kofleriaceae bacterium]